MSDRTTVITKLRDQNPQLAEAFDRWIAVMWPGLPKTRGVVGLRLSGVPVWSLG
jgi:hypothetical protein